MDSQPAQGGPMCKCQPGESGKRNLAVFIDGTSNQFSQRNTNVVELYSRLVKNPKQLTFYNSGIGTYAAPHFWSWRHQKQKLKNAVDLAFAWNFERILLDAYVWLSENYEDGDRIFLFGFSRGAYQIRVLSAMIHMVGLIHKGNLAQVPFAYQLYAATKTIEDIVKMRAHFKQTFSRNVAVHFVGAWDTVSSVGLVRDKTLPGTTDGMKHVCFFRHALALHERRVKFLPEYVRGGQGPDHSQPLPQNEQPHTKEVWFAGSHSDVGGGVVDNPEMDQFGPALRWMSFEALLAGVQLHPAAQQWHPGKQIVHNSMTFGWWILECIPLTHLSYKDPSRIDGPTAHCVRRRHLCAPRQVKPGQLIHETALNSIMGHRPAHGAEGPPGEPVPSDALKNYLCRIPTKLIKKLIHRCAYAISPLVAGGDPWNADASVPSDPWCAHIGLGAASTASMTEKDPYTAAKDIGNRMIGKKDDISDSDFIAFNELTSTEPGKRSMRDNPNVWNYLRIMLDACIKAHRDPAASSSFVNTTRALARAFDEQTLDIVSITESGYDPRVLRPLARALGKDHPRSAARFMRLFAKALISRIGEWDQQDISGSSLAWCAAYYNSGKQIVTGSWWGQLTIYDAVNRSQMGQTLFGPQGPVDCVAVCPKTGTRLVSGHGGGLVIIWKLDEDPPSRIDCIGHNNAVQSVAFSPDGTQVVSGSDDSTIIIWDAKPGYPTRTLSGHVGAVFSVAWSPCARYIASGSADATVRLWNTAAGYVGQTLRGHTATVHSFAFNPSGNHLVSASADTTAIVWDVSTRQQVLAILGHNDSIMSISYSHDGLHIVSGSLDATIRVWNATTAQEEDRLPVVGGLMRTVSFSPDGKRIASACGNIQIWDAERWDYAAPDAQPVPGQTSSPTETHGPPDDTPVAPAQTPETPAGASTTRVPPATIPAPPATTPAMPDATPAPSAAGPEAPAPPARLPGALRAGLNRGRRWAGWLNVV